LGRVTLWHSVQEADCGVKGGGMAGMMRGLAVAVVCLALAACSEGAAPVAAPKRVSQALQQIFPDPAMAAFFEAEAARANVSDMILETSGRDYGSTSFNSGSRRAVIRINVGKPGGRSPTNIAHEIAHAAVFRQGCYNHGERWLAYHLAIAQRFEARFPGVPWSGRRPTDNVAAKAARYPNDHC